MDRPGPGLRRQRALAVTVLNSDEAEGTGRRSFEKGVSPAAPAVDFELPASVSDWHLFNDSYFEVAIRAWQKELGG